MVEGARFNAGKPRLSLVFIRLLDGPARVLEWAYTRGRYRKWNWTLGMPMSTCLDCCLRHLGAWQEGEETDAESGLHPIDHALTNLLMLRWYIANRPDLDDRCHKVPDEEKVVEKARLCERCAVNPVAEPTFQYTFVDGDTRTIRPELCSECAGLALAEQAGNGFVDTLRWRRPR